ncbi:MAG: extracellular solute-binding protein [Opitutaceae bacterium]|nr:extracellular solute-binding protein [Opitutaceae bacterium]
MVKLCERIRAFLLLTTPAVWVLLVLAVGASTYVAMRPRHRLEGGVLWTFSRPHSPGYIPVLAEWSREYPEKPYELVLLDYNALQNRMLSGFLSGTPVADLMEVERNIAARAFTGPLDDVGFVDLTDRLKADGLFDRLNGPSFSPWTSRGRIFGLPHDVHPVLLAYRADIVEAAGIDLSGADTWAKFFAAMRPLMNDTDGDGRPDRFIINFWPTNAAAIEMLILQAGGSFFDADERPTLDTEINARVLVNLATWSAGPARVSVDAPEFSAAGNALKLQGVVLSALTPDWLAGVWKTDLADLSGKWKLMPLPAWEAGGRRTSVQGGSMLGIPKTTRDFEAAWSLAKRLYFDPNHIEAFYRQSNIISPLRDSWKLSVFDEPNAYFSGQPVGRLFINQAPHVPARTSSPYNTLALDRVTNVLVTLTDRVAAGQITDPDQLMPEAHRLLAEEQRQVTRLINRNVFLSQPKAP